MQTFSKHGIQIGIRCLALRIEKANKIENIRGTFKETDGIPLAIHPIHQNQKNKEREKICKRIKFNI